MCGLMHAIKRYLTWSITRILDNVIILYKLDEGRLYENIDYGIKQTKFQQTSYYVLVV